ncbi:MAG: hypothetical protein IPH32_10700 [Bacteroidetes bacterium]|nr:hypothetical protein [Bacteroidota bacterium]
MARKLNAKSRIAQCFSILAGVVYYDKTYDLALAYCDSSLSYLNPEKHLTQCAAVYQKKCDNYIELKQYDLALKFANLYLETNIKDGNVLFIATAYERLYEVNKLMGNADVALSYYERTIKIRDSLRTQEVTETVNELEQKYNKAQNEKQIKELSQQQEIDSLRIRSLIALSSVAALLALVIFFVYRQKSIKDKLKTMETEQRLNRARMNPHFFLTPLLPCKIYLYQILKKIWCLGLFLSFLKSCVNP